MKISEATTVSDMVHFRSFADKQTLAEYLARDVAEQLKRALEERNAASLVVSGGSTPKPFFAALRSHTDIAWEKVSVTLADERWVDTDDEDSNEKLVRENLIAHGMRFTGLKNAAFLPQEGRMETNAVIAALPRPFDVVVLGMGDDGHTASFFPYAPELQTALYPEDKKALCAAITPPDYAPHLRMTLTLPALLDARRIIIHMTGAKKQEVYAKAAADGAIEAMPVRAILRQEQTPVDIYWAA